MDLIYSWQSKQNNIKKIPFDLLLASRILANGCHLPLYRWKQIVSRILPTKIKGTAIFKIKNPLCRASSSSYKCPIVFSSSKCLSLILKTEIFNQSMSLSLWITCITYLGNTLASRGSSWRQFWSRWWQPPLSSYFSFAFCGLRHSHQHCPTLEHCKQYLCFPNNVSIFQTNWG